MYQLLIADDEDAIRNGLQTIVNWEKLGFQVQASFEDGRDVIRHLQTHRNVDAVLTDIKMTFQSGIEVAKFACTLENPPKVILISAYQEVELAMMAIKYNVTDYIMKPIDLDELTAIFRKVAQVLDDQYQVKMLRNSADSFQKNIEDVKEYFFTELALGSIQSAEYLESLFHLLYPTVSFSTCTCFMARAAIQNYEEFLSRYAMHTNNELYTCLKNCIQLSSSQIEFRLVTKQGCQLQLLGILITSDGSKEHALDMIHRVYTSLKASVLELLSLRITLSEPEIFQGIPALLQPQLNTCTDPQSMMLKIEEQKKALYCALWDRNWEETQNVLKRFNSYLYHLDLAFARKMILNFSQELLIRIEQNHPSLTLPSVPPINSCTSMEQLVQCFQAFLRLVSEDIRCGNPMEIDVIEQAKDFIIQHITEDISLESLADHFYLSQCYFSRMFKAKTGEKLIDFIIRQKMELACDLLKTSYIKVYEVSDRVGYKSARYFSKAFKQYTGLTPNAYRLQALSGNPGERRNMQDE